MKKLIAILIVFAMVMGAAFAETTVGGNFKVGFDVFKGNSDADDVGAGNLGIKDDGATVNIGFGDAQAGGKFVIAASGAVNPYWMGNEMGYFAFAWWQPVDQFRLQIGVNPDGDWGFADIVGWGFTAEAKAVGAAVTDYWETLYGGNAGSYMSAREAAFYGGVNQRSLNLGFFPMDALMIGLAFELGDNFENAQDAYMVKTHIVATYALEDIGKIKLAFKTGDALGSADGADKLSAGDVYFAFALTAIDGVGMELGFSTDIPAEDDDASIKVGFGLNFAGDGFGFKLRAGTIIKGDSTTISAGINPNFALGDIRLFIHAGLGVELDSAADTNEISWFLNPYIEAPAGSLKLYTGLKLIQTGVTDGAEPPVWFGLVFGFNTYF